MHPEIHLGSYSINVYWLISYLSVLVASAYWCVQMKKIESVKNGPLIITLIIGFFVQHFGGALFGYLYKWMYFHEEPRLAAFHLAGRYFHSAFITSLVYLCAACWWFKWPTKKALDIYAITAMITSSLSRIGCYFEGCCIGKPAPPPWGVSFPTDPGKFLIPTQLYMFGIETLLCLFLIQINKVKKYNGQTFWIAVLLYSAYRFLIEFFRTNPIFFLGLTHAQVFSLLTLLIAWIVLSRRKS